MNLRKYILPVLIKGNRVRYFFWALYAQVLISFCASFLAEYTYTGKPQCFILRNPQEKTAEFTEYGRDLLSHAYQAYSENDIASFIEKVILKGDDPMRDDREHFAPTIMYNYPHASEAIFEELKHSLG